MGNNILLKKSESLIRCLKRIELKRPDSIEILATDIDLQDIISVNLERAVQITVDMAALIIAEKSLKPSNTMAGSFKVLSDEKIISHELSKKLQSSVGFRNISVHEYNSIDWSMVFDIIHNHLGNFKEFLREVL